MRKYALIIPLVITFLSPWMHKLAYENLMLANIGLDSAEAHVWAMSLSIGSIVIGAFIGLAP